MPLTSMLSNGTNSSTNSSDRKNDINSRGSPSPIAVAIPLVGFALLFMIYIYAFIRHMSIMARKQEDLESQPDIKKIARLNTTVPAEMFAAWKQRQCEEKKDPRAVSLEFSCVICLSEITDEEMVRGLPCHHCFHQQCLDRWYQGYHHRCPLCIRTYYTMQSQAKI